MLVIRKYTEEQRVAYGKQIVDLRDQGFSSKEIEEKTGAIKGSHHYFVRCYLKSLSGVKRLRTRRPVEKSVQSPQVVRPEPQSQTVALLIGKPAQVSEALAAWLRGGK